MRRRRGGHRAALGLAVALIATAVAAAAVATADDLDLSVGVAKGDRLAPCREAKVRGLDALGGCELTVSETPMRFTVVSVFGDQPFAHCPLSYRMRIGPTGSLVLSDIATSQFTGDVHGPCGDTLACRRDVQGPDEDKLPWTGKLSASNDGSLHADIDACFDTCLGRFEGNARLDFEQLPNGVWRMRATLVPVGTSGMEIAGSWSLRPTFGGRLKIDVG
jgi:hypothetical protein